MQSTGIAVYPGKPDSVHRATIDVPRVGDRDVLVDVVRCGVCGTDREIIGGHVGRAPDGSNFLIIGHEMLGRVRQVGQAVDAVKAGDLATVMVRRPDDCPLCQAGQPDMCITGNYQEHGIVGLHGFMQQHVVSDAEYVVRIPDALEPIGVLAEPLTVVEKAVREAFLSHKRFAVWEPKRAIVTGAGPIGILATMLLRSMDMDVWTFARTPAPNAAAAAVAACGATYVSVEERSFDDAVTDIGQIDIALECTGANPLSFACVGAIGRNGVVVLVSISPEGEPMTVCSNLLNHAAVGQNATIIGSVNAGTEDWHNAVPRLETFEKLWPGLATSLITRRVPIDGDIQDAVKRDKGIKTVIEFAPGGNASS